MTRYARSGNTQKHKKMPGAATPWSEFSKQKNSLSKKKGIFKGRKNSHNFSEARQKNLGKEADVTMDVEKSSNYNDATFESHAGNSNAQAADMNTNADKSIPNNESLKKKNRKQNKHIKLQNKEGPVKDSDDNINLPENETFQKGKKDKKKNNTNKPSFSSKAERRQHYMKRKFSDDEESKNSDVKIKKRIKKFTKPCYNCRKVGHLLADCPEKSSGSSNQAIGICFKCGSVDHTSFKCPQKVEGFPFANCFICKQQGHISRNCPENTHGVYVKGGQCNVCGNVNHLKKDCPSLKTKNKEELTATVHTINEGTSIDEEIVDRPAAKPKMGKKPKVVKF